MNDYSGGKVSIAMSIAAISISSSNGFSMTSAAGRFASTAALFPLMKMCATGADFGISAIASKPLLSRNPASMMI